MPFKISFDGLTKQTEQSRIAIFSMLFAGSLIGLLASFVLSIEAIELAKSSSANLPCDLTSIVSCSTVAKHWSARVLGFPNSFIGMATLPVMATIAVAGLAGVLFPKWFMRAAFAGSVLGVLFAGWMFYMSFVVIGALCPWCLTLDLGMVLIFFALLRYQALEQNFCITNGITKKLRSFVLKGYDYAAAVAVIVAVVAAILVKYGSHLW